MAYIIQSFEKFFVPILPPLRGQHYASQFCVYIIFFLESSSNTNYGEWTKSSKEFYEELMEIQVWFFFSGERVRFLEKMHLKNCGGGGVTAEHRC